MVVNKKDDRERELGAFLEKARESKARRDDFEDWGSAPPRKAARSNLWNAGLVIGVIAIVVILVLAVKEIKNLKGIGSVEKIIERESLVSGDSTLKIDQGKYQAVFLTNGQVYFGKISSHDESYVELVDIYYLQVKPVLQQGDENNNKNANPQEQKSEISLVKLGNELHGPLDRMMINKDQIVFVEDPLIFSSNAF